MVLDAESAFCVAKIGKVCFQFQYTFLSEDRSAFLGKLWTTLRDIGIVKRAEMTGIIAADQVQLAVIVMVTISPGEYLLF